MRTKIYSAVEQGVDVSKFWSVVLIGAYGWNTVVYKPSYTEALAVASRKQKQESPKSFKFYAVFKTDSERSLDERVREFMLENLDGNREYQ